MPRNIVVIVSELMFIVRCTHQHSGHSDWVAVYSALYTST